MNTSHRILSFDPAANRSHKISAPIKFRWHIIWSAFSKWYTVLFVPEYSLSTHTHTLFLNPAVPRERTNEIRSSTFTRGSKQSFWGDARACANLHSTAIGYARASLKCKRVCVCARVWRLWLCASLAHKEGILEFGTGHHRPPRYQHRDFGRVLTACVNCRCLCCGVWLRRVRRLAHPLFHTTQFLNFPPRGS